MRRRFIQLADGSLVEVGQAALDLPADAGALWGDAHYRDLRAPDGTPIDTRTKHRAYMRDRGLTTADDYTHEWRRAREEREAFYGRAPDPNRAYDIARAIEERRG